MDLAQKYIKTNKLDEMIIQKINIVRLWKQIYLPIELVGANRNSKTKAYEHINERSIIEWKFLFTTVPKSRGD